MTKMSQQHIEQELVTIVSDMLKEQGDSPQKQVRLDSSLQRHLGIDSLGRAELFHRIEKNFDVSIPDSQLAQAETLQDIVGYIQEAEPTISREKIERVILPKLQFNVPDASSAQTLIDILYLYGENVPEKPHLYFQREDGGEDIITYGELLHQAKRVAARLRTYGLRDSQTVAIMQPTQPGFFYTFLGVLLAGGIPVPIYPPFRMHMLEAYAKTEAHILRNAEVRMLVTFAEAEKLGKLIQGFVPSLRYVLTLKDLLKDDSDITVSRPADDHPAFIQYTSGSTNAPKGVLLTHRNLLANVRGYGKEINMNQDDVAVSWLPLYHDFGLIGAWIGSFVHAVPLVLMTPFSFLNHPERWLWAIHYHRGTMSGGPNFAYELCIRKIKPEQIEGLDLSSWRIAANGAEKVYPQTLINFTERFAKYGFKPEALMPVYGLAESTVGLTIPPLDRGFNIDKVDRKNFEEKRLATPAEGSNTLEFVGCGMPMANHAVRIVDENKVVLPERHVGMLEFTGPSCMQGYYNNPEATAAIMHDGWVSSGDFAYMVNGEVFITGRFKDLIIKAGRNIYPAEIEEIVGVIDGVREGCVTAFGVTDEKAGTEELIVVAETKETDQVNRSRIEDEIRLVVSDRLDMPPDKIILVPPRTVPKTSSGKLQRAASKRMYLDGSLTKHASPTSLQIARLGMKWLGSKFARGAGLLGRTVYTAYVLTMFLLTAIPLAVIVSFSSKQVTAKVTRAWVWLILRLAGLRINISGQECLTQKQPVIYAANHASYLDSLIAFLISPAGTRFVVKKEVFSVPILGMFMRKLDFISLDRTNVPKGLEDTQVMVDELNAGNPLFIFPEGTFGYAAGLRPFKLGAFKVAAEAGCAVCPIAIKGARYVLRDEEYLLRYGKIDITICPPVEPRGDEWQDITQLRLAVRGKIAEYCGEAALDLIAPQVVAPKKSD